MHSLWLILSSVFFGVGGVYCFMHPDTAMEAIALYVGCLIFFGGISQLARYFTAAREVRSGWQLVMALVDTLFGGWLLTSGAYMLFAVFMPYMLAGYILARGILLFVYYFRGRAVASPAICLLAAAVQVVLGAALAVMPLFAAKVFVYAAGAGLLWTGFSCFASWRERGGTEE